MKYFHCAECAVLTKMKHFTALKAPFLANEIRYSAEPKAPFKQKFGYFTAPKAPFQPKLRYLTVRNREKLNEIK